MSTVKRSRTLEDLTGLRTVYRDDKQIAKVRYSLQVKQEIIISKTLSGTQEIPGLKEIRGVIIVLDGERNLVDGSTLTLQLGDGHRWEFFATTGDPISGQCAVVGTGKQDIVAS